MLGARLLPPKLSVRRVRVGVSARRITNEYEPVHSLGKNECRVGYSRFSLVHVPLWPRTD